MLKPDPECCQAEKGGAFTLGPGLMRCSAKPVVIATEREPGDDGEHGSMSLCAECQVELVARFGAGYASFEQVEGRVSKSKEFEIAVSMAAELIECEYCLASPGDACLNRRGVVTKTHSKRMVAAMLAGENS